MILGESSADAQKKNAQGNSGTIKEGNKNAGIGGTSLNLNYCA